MPKKKKSCLNKKKKKKVQGHVFWYCQPCHIMCFFLIFYYWVVICLKIVIEDTKFAQEKLKKHIFSAFLACILITAQYLSIEVRNLLPPQHKLDLSRFCSRHKLNSSSVYWVSQINKNQQREKAHNLFL